MSNFGVWWLQLNTRSTATTGIYAKPRRPYCPIEIMEKKTYLLSLTLFNKFEPRQRPDVALVLWSSPIGVNKIAKKLKDLAETAGWDISNCLNAHSLDSRTVTRSDNGSSQFYVEVHGWLYLHYLLVSEHTYTIKNRENVQILSNGSSSVSTQSKERTAQNFQQNVSGTDDNSYNYSLLQTKQLTTPKRRNLDLDERVMDCRKRPLI